MGQQAQVVVDGHPDAHLPRVERARPSLRHARSITLA
jgi:hypothetical protein